MNKILVFALTGFLLLWNTTFSQEQTKRGTIKVKKVVPKKYLISKATTIEVKPQLRVFRVRAYNYNFKEYFPKAYNSNLFPLMFNYGGLVLTNEKMESTGYRIISYEYEIFKSQVQCSKGDVKSFNLNQPLRELSHMMIGSSIWIKKLVYIDSEGVIHENEIPEFKIEKVK
ncbi:MAG: hypothetical protein IPP64_03360 [Bacteroidetes bacterium]|nr:hypothetical protein [Bacteroidota bacterium]